MSDALALNKNNLTVGTPWKKILYFSVPMLIGNVFQQLYSVIDTVIVGRYVGTDALAAVGGSFPIMFFMISMFMGIGIGATVLIAQFYGAKDWENLNKTTTTTYVILLVGAVLMTVIGLASSGFILNIMNTPTNIFDSAKLYLNITFIGTLPMFGYNMISAILRGIGDSKTPLYFLIFACFVNIALDLLFVIVFNWGVGGAAWATIIAQTLAFIISILYINKKIPPMAFIPKNLKFDKPIFKQIIRIGVPAAIQQMLVSLGLIAVQSLVNSFGSVVIAGFTAASRIENFVFMPIMNLSSAVSTFVGQNIGAKKFNRVKSGASAGCVIALIYCLITFFFFTFCGEMMLELFDENIFAVRAGQEYLQIIAPFYCFCSVMFILAGVMRGAGDSIRPLIVTLSSMWLFRIPSAYILVHQLNKPAGVWWSFVIGWGIGLIMAIIFYKRGKWKNYSIAGFQNVQAKNPIS